MEGIRQKGFKILERLIPWIAGGGMSAGSGLFSIYCTVPRAGSCSFCGGCAVAIFSLAGWAILKGGLTRRCYREDR